MLIKASNLEAKAVTGNPYESLPAEAYWRNAVASVQAQPDVSYATPKWKITRSDRISTAGSCFAQHIGTNLLRAGFDVRDAEPAPKLLPKERQADHGYGIYSARYGNIYTARQMLQLAEEVLGKRPVSTEVWAQNGRYVDALRPTIDLGGHATPQAVHRHRLHHLGRVKSLFDQTDILILTLGLTETWQDRATGRVYPVCPGTIAGEFDDARHSFVNLTFQEILDDLMALRTILQENAAGRSLRFLLTVSPVPLTATASGLHVMQATVYSKAVLRAVAGQMTAMFEDVDYFPSFEIVANPWAADRHYAANLRSVTEAAVSKVMKTFMTIHGIDQVGKAAPPVVKAPPVEATVSETEDPAMKVVCDEELLNAFGRNL